MSHQDELREFQETHKNCDIEIIYPWDNNSLPIAVNCKKHHIFITVPAPRMCMAMTGKELIKCALAGYCKREISCNN